MAIEAEGSAQQQIGWFFPSSHQSYFSQLQMVKATQRDIKTMQMHRSYLANFMIQVKVCINIILSTQTKIPGIVESAYKHRSIELLLIFWFKKKITNIFNSKCPKFTICIRHVCRIQPLSNCEMLNPLIIEYLIKHFKLKNIPKENIFKSLQNNLSN